MYRLWPFIAIVFSFFLTGCSFFISYPEATADAREAFANGNLDYALEEYQSETDDSTDGLCYLLESGLVASNAKKYRESIDYFEAAEQWMDKMEGRATISLAEISEEILALLINDKALPYSGEFFERTLLHSYQAINYLFLGNTEDARVEIRRAQIVQDEAEESYDQELQEAQREQANSDFPEVIDDFRNKLSERYHYPGSYLNDHTNIYQLGITFYLAALVYEMEGDYNDAYIDLKKLHRFNPEFPYVLPDLYRMARKSGLSFEAQKWKNYVPGDMDINTGSIVVLYESGQGPYKIEASFFIPTGAGFQKIAWPIYIPSSQQEHYLEFTIGDSTWTTAPLTDVNSVAIRYHRDRSMARITRLAARLVIKIAAQHAAVEAVRQEHGDAAAEFMALIVSILTSFSEQADDRCWMTLPANYQALRCYLPAGHYTGKISIPDAGIHMNVKNIIVSPNKITLIRARSINHNLYWDMTRESGRNYRNN